MSLKLFNATVQTQSKYKSVGHDKLIMGLTHSAECKKIITGSWDKTIKIWNYKGEEQKTITNHTKR